MDEEQEIQQALGQHARLVVTTVARLSEAAFKAAEIVAERRRALEENHAAEMTARFQAEQAAARSSYRAVEDPQWWANSRPEQVAEAYQLATVWSAVDPEARRIEDLMNAEIRRRYDVDPRAVDLATVPEQLEAAERARARRDAAEAIALTAAADRADRDADHLDEDAERTREGAQSGDLTPAEATVAEVEANRLQDSGTERRADRDGLDEKAEVAWDSAERREATAQDLGRKVDDAQAVDARMRADAAQGRPATEATRKPSKATKARPSRGRGAGRQREQGRGR